jgi:murein DD-endopeptidase MepM/ murein hydrolase activator NlpD
MAVDHGIRADRAGRGHFGASRFHGKHNGLDLLAPIGTDIRAVCAGEARGGTRGAFGNYVHLVCEVPDSLAGDDTMYASLFFAHLQQKNVPHGKWVTVALGDMIGAVGKTGNAMGPSVMPHVHLELILHPTAETARAERHSGKNQSNTVAADRFFRALRASCFDTTGLSSKGPWRRGRRADPFAVLTCLSVKKPNLTEPEAPLDEAWRKWSSHYHADDFDVDVGRR